MFVCFCSVCLYGSLLFRSLEMLLSERVHRSEIGLAAWQQSQSMQPLRYGSYQLELLLLPADEVLVRVKHGYQGSLKLLMDFPDLLRTWPVLLLDCTVTTQAEVIHGSMVLDELDRPKDYHEWMLWLA